MSWSSHHEKKGRGQPRPRTNWATIGLVPLHSGKGRTRKETYWVLAGLSIAGGYPAKACTWQGPGEPPPKYPTGTPGGWHLPRPKASGISTSLRNCPELLTVCSGREEKGKKKKKKKSTQVELIPIGRYLLYCLYHCL